MLGELCDDVVGGVTARRLKLLRCLVLSPALLLKRARDHFAEKAGQRRPTLPSAVATLAARDLFEQREEAAVRYNQMVEALADAPLLGRRLPVELRGRKQAEDFARVLRDRA